MTFSIVIPTYNGERFVEETIISALSQTRLADEIIISDDNSNDQTLEICRKYEEKIKIFKNANGPSGFVDGWNNAIAHSTSEFVSILHQDDLLAPTFLEEIEKAVNDYPDVKHFFCPCNNIDENNNVSNQPEYCDNTIKKYNGTEYSDAYRIEGKPHIHRCPGVVTHRSIFEVCQYRKEAGHIADDDFFYRVGQYTDVVGIMKPLASYRIHKFSETGHLADKILVKRLLHDYRYQLKNMNDNSCISEETKKYFKYWHRRFFLRLLLMSIKDFDIPAIIFSIKNYLF